MKKEKFAKKLFLEKVTISNVDNFKFIKVKGGALTNMISTCPGCIDHNDDPIVSLGCI